MAINDSLHPSDYVMNVLNNEITKVCNLGDRIFDNAVHYVKLTQKYNFLYNGELFVGVIFDNN